VGGAVPGGGGGELLVGRLGAGYRSFRIGPNLSLRSVGLPLRRDLSCTGVSVARVSQIEHGEVTSFEVIARYVEALGGRLDLVADFGDRTVRLPVSGPWGHMTAEGGVMPDAGFTELAGRRVALRRFQLGDVAEFVAYRSAEQVARFQSWDAPYPREAGERFVRQMMNRHPDTPGEWFQFAVVLRATATSSDGSTMTPGNAPRRPPFMLSRRRAMLRGLL
jgi:hypothetical protein